MSIIKHEDIIKKGNPLEELQKELVNTEKLVNKLTKTNVKLAESLQLIKKSSDGAEAKKLTDLTSKLNQETKKLSDSKRRAQELDLERLKVLNSLKKANTDRIQKTVELKTQLAEQNKINKQLARDTLGLVGAYEKESKTLIKLRTEYKNLAVQNKQNTKEGKALLANITKLDTKLKAVDSSVGQNQRSVGKYSDALKNMGRQLVGALGITAGITLLVDQFKKAAERISTLTKLTNRLKGTFDITTKEARKLAIQINAMAQNFDDVDSQKLENSLTAIVKTFGDISEQEALNLIQEGFQKGSNNSGEFLDILKEYPIFFKKAGLSADQMFAIINQQVKEGVYSDKGVDAIKEATISLTENTKIVKDALRPLGESVNLQIRQKVEAGKAFEAMQLISQEMLKLGANSAEAQTIMADVFKGAGEDSDNFVRNLHNLELTLDNVKNETTGLQDANLKLSKSYNTFLTSIEDGNGLIAEMSANTTNFLAEMLDGLTQFSEANLTNKLKILTNQFLALIEKAFIPFISILELLGVEVPKFRFEIEEGTKAIGKNTEATVKSVEVNKKEEEVIVKLTAAQKKRVAEENALNKAFKERDTNVIAPLESLGADKVTLKVDENAALLALEESHLADLANVRAIAAEEDAEINEAEQLIKDQLLSSGTQLASDIFSSFQDEKVAKINADAEAEKQILQDKLDKGLISEQEFAAKSAAIDKKARIASAKADKKKAIFDIAIRTAIAVISALTSIPPNVPLSIAVGVTGGIQAAAVAVKPIPKFAKGEVNIKGKSHAQGGIDTNIEGGESFINKTATANSENLLNMVNDGLITDKNIPVLNKQQDNMLLAHLLMKGNSNSDALITLMSNMGWTYARNGEMIVNKADGSMIEKFNIDG